MGVSTKHKLYDKFYPLWKKCRDVYDGQEKIHENGVQYLAKLADESEDAYNARKYRALFFEATTRTVEGLSGMLFRKQPKVEYDGELDNVDGSNNSLYELMKAASVEGLITGRFGVLDDYPVVEGSPTAADVSDMTPSMLLYKAESIINWKTESINGKNVLVLVVLKETITAYKDQFTAKDVDQYRVLDIFEGSYRVRVFEVIDGEDVQIGGDMFPKLGGNNLERIPFYFYPAVDPVKPPLLGMVNTNISHYKTNADYEHGCHLSGLATFVITGHTPVAGESIYIGGPTAVCIPEPEAKAFFVELKSKLEALKENLASKEEKMAILGSRMLEQQKKDSETAETASIHRSGEASTLSSVAISLSKVFTRALKKYVEWRGDNSDDVVVEINRDFVPYGINPQLITALLQAVQAGKMSHEAFFDNMKMGEMYSEDVDFELEQARIDEQGI